jgi:hypothetical protein
MKNSELAEDFVNQDLQKKEGNNMFIEGNVIYSYGYHFPIAIKLKDRTILFNQDGYSVSTSRHKTYVKNALSGKNFDIHYFTTHKLKEIIDLRVDTYKELIVKNLI